MALYPGAVKELIAPGANDPKIIPIGIILHTDAGNVGDLHDYFDGPSGGIESHFHIPKKATVKQYRDTAYEADANYKANSFLVGGTRYGFISVETQGLATDPWNDYQLTEIKKLILWAKSVHPKILLRVCPGPFDAGIGYHTLFGSPGPWTPVAKSCPGPTRIKQFNQVIVPWLKAASPTNGGSAMAFDTTEVNQIRAACQAENEEYAIRFWIDSTGTGTAVRNLLAAMKDQLDRIEDDTDQLQASKALLSTLDANVNALAERPLQTALIAQGLLPAKEE